MFESTLPFGEPELMRVSAFRRYLVPTSALFGPNRPPQSIESTAYVDWALRYLPLGVAAAKA
jgi:hypothetical protein